MVVHRLVGFWVGFGYVGRAELVIGPRVQVLNLISCMKSYRN